MVGRLQEKVALVVGAGSVGSGWGNGKAAAVLLPAKARRYYAPISTRTPRRRLPKSLVRKTALRKQSVPT
jgi:hypothetical protein